MKSMCIVGVDRHDGRRFLAVPVELEDVTDPSNGLRCFVSGLQYVVSGRFSIVDVARLVVAIKSKREVLCGVAKGTRTGVDIGKVVEVELYGDDALQTTADGKLVNNISHLLVDNLERRRDELNAMLKK